MSGGTPGGPVRASRAARSARRRNGRVVAALLVVAVVAGGGWWVFGRSSGACCPTRASSPSASSTGPPGSAHLLALSISGGPAPYLAVIGAGPGGAKPAAVPIPSALSVMVPGQGETPARGVAALDGPSIQVALSNVVGTWVQDYAVLNVGQVSGLVDRLGGITVDLSLPESTSAGLLAGTVKVTGVQMAALLDMRSGDSQIRWQAVLSGLLAARPLLQRTDLTSLSSLSGVQAVLSASVDAQVVPMPTQTAAGAAAIAQQPQFDALLSSTWHTTPPTPVIVLNGNGRPGVGEAVARLIIPAGFRVVISENAQSFDIVTTDIIANGMSNVSLARKVKSAMKVGLVEASRVPSGIGDITIVVGKDFTA
jgi:LytR cell envelope-related transcriptional attenuator